MRTRKPIIFLLTIFIVSFFIGFSNSNSRAQEKSKKEVPVYDETANAGQDIANALVKAKKDNKRVLIQWGANWCGWCVKLHGLYKEDKKIARKLLYDYEVVYVDMGRFDKNIDVAKKYGAYEKIKGSGIPFLTVLDGTGEVLVNQETGSLEKDKGHDPEKVLAFLTKYAAKPLDANILLQESMKQAKLTNKNIFTYFSAPW